MRRCAAKLQICLALVLAVPCIALADEGDAERAFNEARRLLALKDYAQACPLFERSHVLEPALGTLLNLADCVEKQGLWGKAHRSFVEAARWAQKNADRRREEVARQRLVALRAHVVLLAIEVNELQAMAELRSLGDPTSTLRVPIDRFEPIALDPGVYVLKVMAPNRRSFEKRLELPRPGEVHVLAALEAEQPPSPVTAAVVPPPPPPLTASPAPLRPLFLVGTIGGGLLTAAGLAGVIYSQSVMGRVDRQQRGGPDTANPTVTRREFETAAVLYPTSIIGSAVGVALILVAVFTRERPSETALFIAPTAAGWVVALGSSF